MEINIFELASRSKTRFDTNRGVISSEQLWDMPLTSRTGFDLDTLDQAIQVELEGLKARSRVNIKPNERVVELELQYALVGHVIEFKKGEIAERLAKAEKSAKRAKLLEQLGKKQDAALESLSEDEIKKQLAALDE